MKIIVDANIVFSAILNSNGKIGELLINSSNQFVFISPEFLKLEISNHYDKLTKISQMTKSQVMQVENILYSNFIFVPDTIVSKNNWDFAEKLVFDIDPKDVQYIALAKHFDCKLWSGDKTLIRGLLQKGYTQVIDTNELFDLKNLML